MKRLLFISLIIISFVPEGCSSSNKASKQSTYQNDPIAIAVSDFSKTCKLYKKDSVFYVQEEGLSNHKDLIVVDIGRNFGKMILKADTKIGSKGKLAS
jgi:hypothetical protein